MRKIVASILAGTVVFATGCSAKETGTVYKYDDPDVVSKFTLTKSVYDEDTLTIYHDGTLNDRYNVFSSLDIEYEIDYETVTITYENIDEVTSLVFDNGDYRYMVRYLDSNQYAVLAYIFAMDIGYELFAGDVNDYYTEEELAEQEQNRIEAQAREDDNWAAIEGRYEADNGDVIEFYVDNNGNRTMLQGGNTYPVSSITSDGSDYSADCIAGALHYTFGFEVTGDGSAIEASGYIDENQTGRITYYKVN